jgi:hypothetical protein
MASGDKHSIFNGTGNECIFFSNKILGEFARDCEMFLSNNDLRRQSKLLASDFSYQSNIYLCHAPEAINDRDQLIKHLL